MWRIFWIIILVTGITAWCLWSKPESNYAKAVSDTGALILNDGKTIPLSGVEIPPRGEDGHEAAIFFLKEITKDTELWYENHDGGYQVWVGCRNFFGRLNCAKGLNVNEAVLRAKVAKDD